MNKTDPSWREKMRVRKLEEIQRMEQLKIKVGRELAERQRQLEEEVILSEKLRRMRDEYDEQQLEIRDIERKRRELQLEQEIGVKRRELETIDRQIVEEKRNERALQENEEVYKQFDKKIVLLQENNDPNGGRPTVNYSAPVKNEKPPVLKKANEEAKIALSAGQKIQEAVPKQFNFSMEPEQEDKEELSKSRPSS